MPVSKEVIDAQLARLQVFQTYFTKKEVAHLPEVIQPGETIHAIASGMYDNNTWLVVATDRRVLFLDKGMFAGLKQLSLPLDQIQAVAHSVGMLLGEVAISTAGVTWTIQSMTPKETAARFAQVVEGLVQWVRQQRHAPVVAPQPVQQQYDPLAQLERLAQLRQSGALTDVEFTAAKAKLLGL